VPRVAAEPVPEDATGFEETMAILPEAPAPPQEEDLVVEASLPAEAEEVLVAAEVVAEPGAFIDEAPSPTLLMVSAEEVVEPGVPEPDFSDTATFEDFPEAAPPAPTVARCPFRHCRPLSLSSRRRLRAPRRARCSWRRRPLGAPGDETRPPRRPVRAAPDPPSASTPPPCRDGSLRPPRRRRVTRPRSLRPAKPAEPSPRRARRSSRWPASWVCS
jgi:hypothetical protein